MQLKKQQQLLLVALPLVLLLLLLPHRSVSAVQVLTKCAANQVPHWLTRRCPAHFARAVLLPFNTHFQKEITQRAPVCLPTDAGRRLWAGQGKEYSAQGSPEGVQRKWVLEWQPERVPRWGADTKHLPFFTACRSCLEAGQARSGSAPKVIANVRKLMVSHLIVSPKVLAHIYN